MTEQMKMEAERAAFEAWVIPGWSLEKYTDHDGDTVYVEDWVQGAWMCWQARAALGAQPAVNGYTCTVPDDCETLHWRGQILSMNELASVAQPAVGEEIHVHIEGQDVLTLPLASSGMGAPRFVVHVPAHPAAPHHRGQRA